MDYITAAILGLTQGLTEFLPVSSSGHVALGSLLLGYGAAPLSFIVALHTATLLATIFILRDDLQRILRDLVDCVANPKTLLSHPSGREITRVVIATLAFTVIALPLRPLVTHATHVLGTVGMGFLISAALLISTRASISNRVELTKTQALLVGAAQGIAVFPGISRSGATIAVAMALGLYPREAFRFSFLLSIPAIIGATILQLSSKSELLLLGPEALLAATVALLSGIAALVLLRKLLLQGRFWIFALYLLPLGLAVIAWDWLH